MLRTFARMRVPLILVMYQGIDRLTVLCVERGHPLRVLVHGWIGVVFRGHDRVAIDLQMVQITADHSVIDVHAQYALDLIGAISKCAEGQVGNIFLDALISCP